MTGDTALTDNDIARIGERLDRPVVLVGLMGAGKSTVGRRLAAMLGREFIDADDAIEEAAQRSVAEIFDEFGETYFRDGERRVSSPSHNGCPTNRSAIPSLTSFP